MAKKRTPQDQIKAIQKYSYRDAIAVMQSETASILTDYIRQYVGIAKDIPANDSGVYMNQDRIMKSQAYQELAQYDLYDEVERDPHVHSVLQSSRLNVAGLDWDVLPYVGMGKEATARDKAIADFVFQSFLDIEDFQQDLYEFMDALGKGFSVGEVIYKVDTGIRIEKILSRPQRRFQFDATTREPKLRVLDNPYLGNALPKNKFIVHRVSAKYENPFGDAIDQTLYWMWLFKKMVMKFWMQNLETATSPIPIVKIPRGASRELKAEADAVAAAIRSGTFGRIPDNFEILYAEAQNMQAANISYESFLHFVNDEMTKSINGQTLTTEGSGRNGAGSKALGSVHQATQDQRDIYRAKGLASTLNSTVVKWLVDFNFGAVSGYPRFSFKLEAETDKLREAQIIKTLFDAGYETEIQEVEDMFGYSMRKENTIDNKNLDNKNLENK